METMQSTHINTRSYSSEIARHSHDYHQLVIPLKGWLELDISGSTTILRTGIAAVVPCYNDHSFSGSGANSFLVFDVPQEEARSNNASFWNHANNQPYLKIDETIDGYCRFIAQEAELKCLYGVRSLLAVELLISAIQRNNDGLSEALPLPLNRAIAFINKNYCEAINIHDVARAAHISETRLHHLFRSKFSSTPKKYIRARKMQKAAILLKSRELRISEIAQQVGYADQSAFTRAFEKHYSTTPMRYRTSEE